MEVARAEEIMAAGVDGYTVVYCVLVMTIRVEYPGVLEEASEPRVLLATPAEDRIEAIEVVGIGGEADCAGDVATNELLAMVEAGDMVEGPVF